MRKGAREFWDFLDLEDVTDLCRENMDVDLQAAIDHHCKEDWKLAEVCYRNVLASTTILLPPHHPDVLAVESKLATVLLAQGRFSSARSLLSKLVKKLTVALPKEHPMIASTRAKLASASANDGHLYEAIFNSREALRILSHFPQAADAMPPLQAKMQELLLKNRIGIMKATWGAL